MDSQKIMNNSGLEGPFLDHETPAISFHQQKVGKGGKPKARDLLDLVAFESFEFQPLLSTTRLDDFLHPEIASCSISEVGLAKNEDALLIFWL